MVPDGDVLVRVLAVSRPHFTVDAPGDTLLEHPQETLRMRSQALRQSDMFTSVLRLLEPSAVDGLLHADFTWLQQYIQRNPEPARAMTPGESPRRVRFARAILHFPNCPCCRTRTEFSLPDLTTAGGWNRTALAFRDAFRLLHGLPLQERGRQHVDLVIHFMKGMGCDEELLPTLI